MSVRFSLGAFIKLLAEWMSSLVNVGLLSFASYSLYTRPHLRKDTRLLVSAAAAAFGLLTAEGYAAEKYLQTPAGREEERRARQEGAVLYRVARENILRPGVLGGMLGVCKSLTVVTFSHSANS